MNTYYFTYGLDEQYPFRGGWTEIVVPDNLSELDARNLFRIIHPNREESNCLNRAWIYSQKDFEMTEMAKGDNFGERCWERIILTIEQTDD